MDDTEENVNIILKNNYILALHKLEDILIQRALSIKISAFTAMTMDLSWNMRTIWEKIIPLMVGAIRTIDLYLIKW